MRIWVPWIVAVVVAAGAVRAQQEQPKPPTAADHVRAGNAAYRASRYAQAVREYEKALKLEPSRGVQLNLGHAHLRLEQWDRAIRAYARAEPADAWSWIAECHLRKGRTAEAERALTAHLMLNPGDADAEARRATLLVRLGRHESALLAYRDKARQFPDDPKWVRLVAQELSALGRPDAAMTALEVAWRLGDRTNGLGRTLGDLCLARELYPEAASYYEAALAGRDDASAEDWFRLGYTYFQAKSYVAAQRYFDRAATLDPKHAPCRLYLGNVALQKDDTTGAAAHFRAALERDPELADAHVALGNLALGRDDGAAALKHYERAIALGDRTLAVHYNRVLALERAGRRDEALAALKVALHAHPEHQRLLRLLDRLARAGG